VSGCCDSRSLMTYLSRRDFVRTRSWLVNTSGRRDGFYPIDLGQEHGVRDIKVSKVKKAAEGLLNRTQCTFDSSGPGVTWDYIKRISGAIPTLRKFKDHFQYHWNNYSRYSKHSSPTYENNVKLLCDAYEVSEIHKKKVRKHKESFPDVYQKGEEALGSGKVIQKWHERRKRKVSEKQVWTEDRDDDILSDMD